MNTLVSSISTGALLFVGSIVAHSFILRIKAVHRGDEADDEQKVWDCIVVGLGGHGSSSIAHLAMKGLKVISIAIVSPLSPIFFQPSQKQYFPHRSWVWSNLHLYMLSVIRYILYTLI